MLTRIKGDAIVGLNIILGVWVLAVAALAVHLNDGITGMLSILYMSFVGSFPSIYYAHLVKKSRGEKEKSIKKEELYSWD